MSDTHAATEALDAAPAKSGKLKTIGLVLVAFVACTVLLLVNIPGFRNMVVPATMPPVDATPHLVTPNAWPGAGGE